MAVEGMVQQLDGTVDTVDIEVEILKHICQSEPVAYRRALEAGLSVTIGRDGVLVRIDPDGVETVIGHYSMPGVANGTVALQSGKRYRLKAVGHAHHTQD